MKKKTVVHLVHLVTIQKISHATDLPSAFPRPPQSSQGPKWSQGLAVHLQLVAALLQVAEPFGGLLDLALKLGHRAWQQNIGLVNPPLEEMKNEQNPLVSFFFWGQSEHLLRLFDLV